MKKFLSIIIVVLLSLTIKALGDNIENDNLPLTPEINIQLGHNQTINDLWFSPDGKYVVSKAVSTFKLWDVSSGKEIRTFPELSTGIIRIDFSTDGKQVISKDLRDTIKIWDLSSRKKIESFHSNEDGNIDRAKRRNSLAKITRKNFSDNIKEAAFSPNGKMVLYTNGFDSSIELLDARDGKQIEKFTAHTPSDNSKSYEAAVNATSFSPDGEYFVSCSGDKTLKLWKTATCKEVRTFVGHTGGVTSCAFSPDGKYVVSSSSDKTLKLWDVASGKEVRTFTSPSSSINSVAVSPDGKLILSGSDDNTLKLLDRANGKVIKTFSEHTARVNFGVFSPDGKLILSGSDDNTLKLWDIANGKVIKTFSEQSSLRIESASFSPDGKFIIYSAKDKEIRIGSLIKLLDLSSGSEIRPLSNNKFDESESVFLPNGNQILTLGEWSGGYDRNKRWKLCDLLSGKEIKSIEGTGFAVNSVAISPDNKLVLSGSGNPVHGRVEFSDLETGKLLKSIMSSSSVNSVAFSPDGKMALSGSDDQTLILWDVASQNEIKSFKGHSGIVKSVAFSSDGKAALSGSNDGTIRIWDIATGNFVAFMNHKNQKDWLIFTNDGYWDASPNGGDLVAMVQGMKSWNIDQFAVKNNRPDIILQRLGSTETELISHYNNQYKKRLRKLGFTEEQLSSEYHVPTAEITKTIQNGKFAKIEFTLNDEKYELKNYNVFVNNVPLHGAYGKTINGKHAKLKEKIELTSGDNKIEISCMNEKAAESYRAMTMANYTEKVKGDLYVLALGVSKYQNAELNLKYADKDALDLTNVFKSLPNTEYAKVYTKTLLNEEVTAANIKSAKEFIKNAKVDDTFILFIAGHGVHDQDAEATYYYLTNDAKIDNLKATAADFDLIEDLMQNINPRKKLFLMDTCESGEQDETTEKQSLADAGSRGIKARGLKINSTATQNTKPERRKYLLEKDRFIYNDLTRRSGSIVFSSSQGGEYSYESDAIQNGYFTKEIMTALTGKTADKDNDGQVSTDELREFVAKSVSEKTGGLQNPTVDRDNIYQKWNFPIGVK